MPTPFIQLSALNAACDPSGLPRAAIYYKNQLIVGGRFSPAAIKQGVGPVILDCEAETWPDVVKQSWLIEEAIAASKTWASQPVASFYGFPYPDWTIAARADMADKWLDINAAIKSIAKAVDFFTPCLYLPDPATSIDEWLSAAESILAVCRLFGKGKPVMPFLWHKDITLEQEISSLNWQIMLDWTRRKCEGRVLWTKSNELNVKLNDPWLVAALAS